MPNFICQEAQHNKFWNYTINGMTVNIEYGRVGGNKQTDVKSFTDQYSLNAFVQKKVREKEGKGYKAVTEEKLVKESNIAQSIGTQNKICEMNFVEQVDSNKLHEIMSYDENKLILVKMMNSWNKEESHYIIGKDICKKITNCKRSGFDYSIGHTYNADYNIKQGLIAAIEDIAGKIESLIDYTTLTRSINLETDESKKKIKIQEFTRKINLETGICEQVAEKFMSLGTRKMLLDVEGSSDFITNKSKRKMML